MPRPMSCAVDSFDDRDDETNCTGNSRALLTAHSPTLAQEGIQMRQRADYPTFSDDEIERRHKAVYRLIEQEGVDAILFYGSGRYASDIYWLSDWPSSREAYLLMQTGSEPVILMQLFNHYPMARVMSWITDVRWAGANTTDSVVDLVRERGLESKRLGLVGSISYQVYHKLRESYPGASFIDLGGKLRMMRAVRSAEEIERIRLASKLTDQSVQALAENLKVGLREDELPAIIEPVYLKAGGYAGIHFMSSMPMRDPDFPVPSQFHSRRKLQKGDALITEISGAYSGYSGQIHRTFSIGEGPTPEWQKMHAAAMEAFDVLSRVIKDGATTTEAEEAAEIIHQRGYSTYDDLVHGVNQYPPIFQTKTRKRHDSKEIAFRENMVIVIQPNLMTENETMGLQFGETLVVKKNGCESLNAYPREWVTCGG
ncbi:MAG: aminopeptidase P family protein [Deltaproteobacteria bacterium]|nr:MAG: aminopeptidase P family protein [Deltaproteobacteria bacterium]